MKRLLLLLAVILISANAYAQCPNGQTEVVVTIVPDGYPNETSWTLNNAQTNVQYAAGGSNNGTVCVPNNVCLRFTINDSYGDGMCCNYGQGSYTVTFGGQVVASGGQFTHTESAYFNCPPGYSCNSAIPVGLGNYTAPVANTWYAFTPDSIGTYLITTCNTNTCDTKIWVYSQCNGLTWNDAQLGTDFYDDDGGGCGTQAVVTAYLDSAQTYYIRIGDDAGNCGNNGINWALQYVGPVVGCMDPNSCNYNPLATVPGTCIAYGDPDCPFAPDLMIDQGAILGSLDLDQVTTDNCYVQEGCVTGYGLRDIIRFTTHIRNIGEMDYYIGTPQQGTQFVFDPCHQHWHYVGYAEYLLFDMQGNSIPVGFKNGFCVLDLECSGGGSAQYGCENMGISAGCGDIYDSGLPCQWIDITDVDTGKYTMVVRVNWDQSPDALGRVESTFENNQAQVCIHLTRDQNGMPQFTIDTNCPQVVDCMGVPFGTSVSDCNGTCNGTAIKGDIDGNSLRESLDAQKYVHDMLTTSVPVLPCLDLSGNGSITVFDAALDNKCALLGNPTNGNECNFPINYVNFDDTVTLSIEAVNIAQNYVDIAIKDPTHKVNAYQFTMHGINILGVQNLVNPVDYPINPEYTAGGQEVIGISYQGLLIDKYTTPTPLCRIYFTDITDTVICIESITDIVNENYERTINNIGGTCYKVPATGLSESLASMGVKVWPNPSDENFNLQISSPMQTTYTVQVLDMTGRVVRSFNLAGRGQMQSAVNMEGLDAGIYSLTVSTGKQRQTMRLVYLGK